MRPQRLRRIAMGTLAMLSLAALAVPAWPAGALTPVVIYQCDLTATFVQATTVSRGTYDVDAKVSDDIKSDLIRKFGRKYMKYEFVRAEKSLLTWDKEDPANKGKGPIRVAEIALDGDKTLVITWISYNIGHAVLNFQFQTGTTFALPDIPSGTNYIMKLGDDPNPMLLVISPKLVRTTK